MLVTQERGSRVGPRMAADAVVAVIGKTEGNGGVNDFTWILSDNAFRGVLLNHGTGSEAEVSEIPMVWSVGCDGLLTPHATVFARNDETGPRDMLRLAMGTRQRCRPRAAPLPRDRRSPAPADPVNPPPARGSERFGKIRSACTTTIRATMIGVGSERSRASGATEARA